MTDTDSNFSAGETKLLISILRNCDGQINANWDRVAQEMGYKDASIAKTRWGQIKKKKISGEITSPTKKSSPKKAAVKRKVKDVDSGTETMSPAESAKKKVKDEIDGGSEEMEGSNDTVKKEEE